MAIITVMDPVTRIEGHMKVEVTIDAVDGEMQVVDARCTGTLFRGFERILVGRDPKDATVITSRICGVCPVSHSMASVRCLEDAAGCAPPSSARVVRNLILGANFLQSHILHFYLLGALDYVRGPQGAPWTPAWDVDLRSDPALDIVAGHLTQALEARRRAHEMAAVFGGRMPLQHAFVPGGVTAPPTAERIHAFRGHLDWLTGFIRDAYLPDVEALGRVYSDFRNVGVGWGNLMAYGVFDLDDSGSNHLLAGGFVEDGAADPVSPPDGAEISESVAYSWYEDATEGLAPAAGETRPVHPKGEAYSWLKAPRLSGKPFEAGPLARMWINGDYRRGISVMDRHAARAHEALKIAAAMDGWLDQLTAGDPVYGSYRDPVSGSGVGMTEAPRGALGHWVEIAQGKIARYQVLTPTCWNASPRDGDGVPGPMEKALMGTPVRDPARPVEALRVIHSFDPCLSCAVHVMRPDGPVTVLPAGAVP